MHNNDVTTIDTIHFFPALIATVLPVRKKNRKTKIRLSFFPITIQNFPQKQTHAKEPKRNKPNIIPLFSTRTPARPGHFKSGIRREQKEFSAINHSAHLGIIYKLKTSGRPFLNETKYKAFNLFKAG